MLWQQPAKHAGPGQAVSVWRIYLLGPELDPQMCQSLRSCPCRQAYVEAHCAVSTIASRRPYSCEPLSWQAACVCRCNPADWWQSSGSSPRRHLKEAQVSCRVNTSCASTGLIGSHCRPLPAAAASLVVIQERIVLERPCVSPVSAGGKCCRSTGRLAACHAAAPQGIHARPPAPRELQCAGTPLLLQRGTATGTSPCCNAPGLHSRPTTPAG